MSWSRGGRWNDHPWGWHSWDWSGWSEWQWEREERPERRPPGPMRSWEMCMDRDEEEEAYSSFTREVPESAPMHKEEEEHTIVKKSRGKGKETSGGCKGKKGGSKGGLKESQSSTDTVPRRKFIPEHRPGEAEWDPAWQFGRGKLSREDRKERRRSDPNVQLRKEKGLKEGYPELKPQEMTCGSKKWTFVKQQELELQRTQEELKKAQSELRRERAALQAAEEELEESERKRWRQIRESDSQRLGRKPMKQETEPAIVLKEAVQKEEEYSYEEWEEEGEEEELKATDPEVEMVDWSPDDVKKEDAEEDIKQAGLKESLSQKQEQKAQDKGARPKRKFKQRSLEATGLKESPFEATSASKDLQKEASEAKAEVIGGEAQDVRSPTSPADTDGLQESQT